MIIFFGVILLVMYISMICDFSKKVGVGTAILHVSGIYIIVIAIWGFVYYLFTH